MEVPRWPRRTSRRRISRPTAPQQTNFTNMCRRADQAGTPSVTVDAVALVLAPAAAEMLCKDGTAVQFVMDGYGHLKAIGASEGAQVLLQKAGAEKDKGVIGLGEDFIKNAGRRFWDREPRVRTLA
jgi:catalase